MFQLSDFCLKKLKCHEVYILVYILNLNFRKFSSDVFMLIYHTHCTVKGGGFPESTQMRTAEEKSSTSTFQSSTSTFEKDFFFRHARSCLLNLNPSKMFHAQPTLVSKCILDDFCDVKVSDTVFPHHKCRDATNK